MQFYHNKATLFSFSHPPSLTSPVVILLCRLFTTCLFGSVKQACQACSSIVLSEKLNPFYFVPVLVWYSYYMLPNRPIKCSSQETAGTFNMQGRDVLLHVSISTYLFGLSIFYSGIEYTEKDWVRHYPLQVYLFISLYKISLYLVV